MGTLAKTCVRVGTLGIEDAGRVGDPTSIARPCNHEVLGEIQKP